MERLESNLHFPRLALLGVGYIGGSAALAARRAGLVSRIVGYDRSEAATAAALRKGVIDEVANNPAEAVRDATLVLLAAPVCSLGTLLRDIAGSLASDATVVDVGSVKTSIVAVGAEALPDGAFVGCHPMAGAEFSGVEAADAEIFPGRVCFVCPADNSRESAIVSARSFWRGLGCVTTTLDPETHDRLMASQSHLPHVAAFALAAALSPSLPFLENVANAGGPTTSLRDTTRIAASGPGVWRDILLANARHLLPLVEQLEASVAAIKVAIARHDAEALERILSTGQDCRRRLVKE